ncbi:MAG: NAD(P)/FAD-dependent oxidoreductase [Oscillospiraceae bacterium]|jgi:glycerol-3-phosphate dehydrogenase|nr:NAD(P)/FAD-dependent oxidoreductase [Oscillospiraceae bacterium]
MTFDVLIIGAGVTGCAIARELSRHDIKTAVIDKNDDVSMGTSKANSAIVHAGYDAKPGTMKARMNMLGNPMFDALSRELDFPFKRNGSLVLCFDDPSRSELEKLKTRGEGNGVPGLEIIDRKELLAMEPHIGSKVLSALFAPTGGIVCPYEMTIALAENAAVNGVSFYLGRLVTGIERTENVFTVTTGNGVFKSRVLINAAGVFADDIHNMLSADKVHIIPRSGQYILMDKNVGGLARHTLFQLPNEMGKGVLVTPTVDGNLLLGPTAVDIDDKNNTATKREQFEDIIRVAGMSMDHLPLRQVITSFTGLRAHSTTDDFMIAPVPDVPGMIDVAGIESPGLTSAPAIGAYVRDLVGECIPLPVNKNFISYREGIARFRDMDIDERNKRIKDNPAYGHIVCRCETISEAEIVCAIHRPLGAKDIDAVKRRTRAGMGRCQGGFCSPQVAAILSRELDIPMTDVMKSGPDTPILVGKNKEI